MTATATTETRGLSADALSGPASRHTKERIIGTIFFGAALVSVLISALIILSLVREAWTFISQVDWAVTWGQDGWYPRRGLYDMPTLLVSSLIVTVVAMFVAAPLGLGSAIYLSEYASRRARGVLKPVLEILAGVPSVVLGFFALFFLSPQIVERINRPAWLIIGAVLVAGFIVMAGGWARKQVVKGLATGKQALMQVTALLAIIVSALVLIWWVYKVANFGGDFTPKRSGQLAAAAIGVGILTIPLIASVAEDALASVPRHLREASAGLGARKATTTVQVVLPAAVSGIVAAFIIGISRALGETMVVFMAGGASDAARFTSSPFDGGLTLTAGMASLATGTDNVVGEGLTFQSLYFVGMVLFLITLFLNFAAGRFVAKVRERY